MTNYPDEESDKIINDGLRAVEAMRERVKQIEQAKASQPERLAQARSKADEARGWSMLEEPFSEQVSTIVGHNEYGDDRSSLSLPNMVAKELFGTRLCFDLLDAGDDWDKVDVILNRTFTMAGGDTGVLFLLMASALSTISTLVVPQMLEEIEGHGNWDARVLLAEARAKAWSGRVDQLRDDNEDDLLGGDA